MQKTALAILGVIELAMFLRAILSWFASPESRLLDFLYSVTEPAIAPVRALCEHFGWFEDLPIDIPFIITMLLLSLIETLIEIL